MSIISYQKFETISNLIKEKGVEHVLENLDTLRTDINESDISNDDLSDIVKDINEGLIDSLKGMFSKLKGLLGKKTKAIDALIGDTSYLDKNGKFKSNKVSGEFAKMEIDYAEKDSKLTDRFYDTKDEKVRAQLKNEQKALDAAYEAKKNMLESKIKQLIGKDSNLATYANAKKAEIDYAVAELKYELIAAIGEKTPEVEGQFIQAKKDANSAKVDKDEAVKKLEDLAKSKENNKTK